MDKLNKIKNWYSYENQKDKLPYTLLKPDPELMKELNCKIICEVGVRTGKNFINMVKCNPDEAYAVDIWKAEGDHVDIYFPQSKLDKYHDDLVELFKDNKNINIVRKFSVDAAKDFSDNYFDLIFIDALHTYNGVKSDINSWYRKVKSGGIFCGHDYLPRDQYGVVKAVNEMVKEYNLEDRFFVAKIEGGKGGNSLPSWYVVKP